MFKSFSEPRKSPNIDLSRPSVNFKNAAISYAELLSRCPCSESIFIPSTGLKLNFSTAYCKVFFIILFRSNNSFCPLSLNVPVSLPVSVNSSKEF